MIEFGCITVCVVTGLICMAIGVIAGALLQAGHNDDKTGRY